MTINHIFYQEASLKGGGHLGPMIYFIVQLSPDMVEQYLFKVD